MLALHVSLRVHDDKLDKFLAAITENSACTFNDEVGCKYFDVLQDSKDPLHFHFYELYDDEAAIDAHRAALHFAKWREAAAECVVPGSQVNTISRQLMHYA